jgi:hypothetical protein
MARLRQPGGVVLRGLTLAPKSPVELSGAEVPSLDIELVIDQGSSSSAGLRVRPWGVGSSTGTGATLVVNWSKQLLEVRHDSPVGYKQTKS